MAIEGAIFSPRQLIDEHKNFNNDSLQAAVQALGPCGKQYYTVAIIGCQNSGKSTLLNHLFGTDFKVLQGEAGNRTTRGVILGRDKEASLLVMDVEGNDSYESHLTGDENYERMVSSFALVGANVLLVNVWEKQVGQHSGTQYQTLSIVMRICIDQFKLESPKTILFCLRDSNTPEYGQGELKRKLQQDVLKLWRDVWAGAKKTTLSDKYQSTPERFFTLQVAFLREYDVDYPEDFEADILKLRERFLEPSVPGYLFRKQNQEHNLPVRDLAPLLSHVWNNLINHKELNLPNEKVQLANYRCQQIVQELKKKFESGIDEQAGLRNYGVLLDKLSLEFKEATNSYPKIIADKWELELLDRVKAKVRKAVNEAVDQKQKELQQNFQRDIVLVFYDPAHSFKAAVQILQLAVTESQVEFFKQLNFEIPDRKERIEKLSDSMKVLQKAEEENKLKQFNEMFESDGRREVSMLSATALKDHFGMQFWDQLGNLFREKKILLLNELDSRFEWARGRGATAAELDKYEENLTDWLKIEVKKDFDSNLGEKLIEYFHKNFNEDHQGVRYDYTLMNDEIVDEHLREAKEMAFNLLKNMNNFTLTFNKRSSFIDEDHDQQTKNPFMAAGQVLTIRENIQKRANEEYAAVVRRRNEAQMKKIPNYLYLLILYFVYDDIWFTAEDSPFLHYSLSILLVIGLLPLALGQGPLLHQAFNMAAESAHKLYQTGKSHLQSKKAEKAKQQ